MSPQRARDALALVGWPEAAYAAKTAAAALATGATWLTDDAFALIAQPALEVASKRLDGGNPDSWRLIVEDSDGVIG